MSDAEFWALTPRQFRALLERHKERIRREDAFFANICRWIYMCAPIKNKRNRPLKEFMLFGR